MLIPRLLSIYTAFCSLVVLLLTAPAPTQTGSKMSRTKCLASASGSTSPRPANLTGGLLFSPIFYYWSLMHASLPVCYATPLVIHESKVAKND